MKMDMVNCWRKTLTIFLIFISCFMLLGNIRQGSAVDYEDIKSREAKNRIDADGTIFILDVRSSPEYLNDGHILGAVNINVYYLNYEKHQLPELNETGIIVYCDNGFRSKTAAEKLIEFGYTNVSNMEDGFNGWKSNGFPFIIGSDPEPTSVTVGLNVFLITIISITGIFSLGKIRRRK